MYAPAFIVSRPAFHLNFKTVILNIYCCRQQKNSLRYFTLVMLRTLQKFIFGSRFFCDLILFPCFAKSCVHKSLQPFCIVICLKLIHCTLKLVYNITPSHPRRCHCIEVKTSFIFSFWMCSYPHML